MTGLSLIWFHVILTLCVSKDSQGFVVFFSEDLVIKLQSKPLFENRENMSVHFGQIQQKWEKKL